MKYTNKRLGITVMAATSERATRPQAYLGNWPKSENAAHFIRCLSLNFTEIDMVSNTAGFVERETVTAEAACGSRQLEKKLDVCD